MSASSASARHETRALLRAHLAAATSYRHLTRHCPICHRLLRLALEPSPHRPGECEAIEAGFVQESAVRDEPDGEQGERGEDESPANA
ncbi:DUF6274 family protein [Streptomyces alboniger]|uniref:Uncharacterized protein n=1 Tax=Streptomyces alboniger TaxID=132473 RepID=A0A5J6HPK1_STRAD|nr:DUF6274 family protein [Streptomyces alboniger]QEV18925.1 hypothetical protein CP975_16800 [Streptomyces alboniger]